MHLQSQRVPVRTQTHTGGVTDTTGLGVIGDPYYTFTDHTFKTHHTFNPSHIQDQTPVYLQQNKKGRKPRV